MQTFDTEIVNKCLTKRFTQCESHGENVEALYNGKCLACFNQIKALEEQKELQRIHLKRKIAAFIPPRFMECNFDNYNPENYRMQEFLKFTQAYNFDKNILMVGHTGNGKTHLACAILDKALQINKSGLYLPFYKAVEYKIKKPEIFVKALNCDLLVIDEYGVYDSDFKNNLLFEIINERYNNYCHTIIISNMTITKFKESIGDPLYSRLRENVIVKACDWDDYRLKKVS
jgi:DNA replication protein DnaC